MCNIYTHMSLTSHLELRKPSLNVLLLTGGRSEHDFFFFLFVFSLLSVYMCVYLHMSAHGQVRRRRWVSCSLSLSHCFLSLCLILNPELGWWPVSPTDTPAFFVPSAGDTGSAGTQLFVWI